jgi:hypothetical protein
VPRGCLGVSSVQLVQSANVSKRKSEGQTGAIAPHWSLIAWSPGRLVAWSLIAPHLMLPSMMTDMRVTSTFSLSLQEEGGTRADSKELAEHSLSSNAAHLALAARVVILVHKE